MWWKERIGLLTEINYDYTIKACDIYNKLGKPSLKLYEKGVWTIKKLVIYNYYIDIYTKIIRKHFGPYYYFDLFSGSGLVNVKIYNKDLIVFGSPLLSVLTKPQYRFDKYVLVEKDKQRCNILERIFDILKGYYNIDVDYEIINVDMNNIDKYIHYMNECEHALVIVDPEGLEPKWTTISQLLNKECDIIITFMKSGINRVLGRAKSSNADKNTLEYFIGTKLSTIPTINELEDMYIKNIQLHNKNAYRTIEVGAKNFDYDIIIAAKETRKGSPWLDALEKIRKRLKISDDNIESIAAQILGIQSSLDSRDFN